MAQLDPVLLRDLQHLMLLPGLCGHEYRVRKYIRDQLSDIGLNSHTDGLGNLISTLPGDTTAPSVMLFTHMDQLGFVVRKIEIDGFVRLERVGGVPERALAAQTVLFQLPDGKDRFGVIANKSHHATSSDEKYQVVRYKDAYVDTGLASRSAVIEAGINVGTPVVYKPSFLQLTERRISGTAVDDRAGCAVLIDVCRKLIGRDGLPTIHVVFSVQEEFNLRGVMTAVHSLNPDIAVQLDLLLCGDSPDMQGISDVALGAGPGISLYSFHGRGTLNGTIPHPALTALFESAAHDSGIPLQRSAQSGVLTETAYVQLSKEGVACIDIGFPLRHTHSANEVCDLHDLAQLAELLSTAMARVGSDFSLNPDDYPR